MAETNYWNTFSQALENYLDARAIYKSRAMYANTDIVETAFQEMQQAKAQMDRLTRDAWSELNRME